MRAHHWTTFQDLPLGKRLAAAHREGRTTTAQRDTDDGVELFVENLNVPAAAEDLSGLGVAVFDGGTAITFTALGTRMVLVFAPDVTTWLLSSLEGMRQSTTTPFSHASETSSASTSKDPK